MPCIDRFRIGEAWQARNGVIAPLCPGSSPILSFTWIGRRGLIWRLGGTADGGNALPSERRVSREGCTPKTGTGPEGPARRERSLPPHQLLINHPPSIPSEERTVDRERSASSRGDLTTRRRGQGEFGDGSAHQRLHLKV